MYVTRIDTYNCQLNLKADNRFILYPFNIGLMKYGIYINQFFINIFGGATSLKRTTVH
jgi:hypothetical protein